MHTCSRREFLVASSALALGGAAGARPRGLEPPGASPGVQPVLPPAAAPLPTVTLGTTGRLLPRLGLGGAPLSTLASDDDGVAVVRRAIELGVRYIDTAPSYGDGRSERRVGLALGAAFKGGLKREDFFIATKTLHRDAQGARRELEASLKRLGLAYVDSVQCHEVHDDVDRLFGEGAVTKGLEKARDEGLVRHIGVTGHRNPKWLIQAVRAYPFVTALVPVNPIDRKHLSFIDEFLPVAQERKVAVIAMKIFGGGYLVQNGTLTAAECLTYALAQPGVAVAVPGCDKGAQVEEAHAAVAAYAPPAAEFLADLERRAGDHKGKASEWYKDEKPK